MSSVQLFLPKWPSSHGSVWAVGIAGTYSLVWWLNSNPPFGLEVVEDRVSLIHLPAFVRVAAVMIGGLAGWLGIWLGSLFLAFAVLDDAPLVALLNATSATLSVGLAAILVAAWTGKRSGCLKSINIRGMLLTAGLAALLNAAFHNFVWQAHGLTLSLSEFWMMVAGDLGGVALGYLLLRAGLRIYRSRRGLSQP